jgi:hypothetical protein
MGTALITETIDSLPANRGNPITPGNSHFEIESALLQKQCLIIFVMLIATRRFG